MASLSPGQSLVAVGVRAALAGRDGASVCADPAAWASATELAFQTGLMALVHVGASASHWPVPSSPRAKLRAGYFGAQVRVDVCLEPTLRVALAALHRSNLEPIVVKGGALAYTAYDEPALRAMSDVDLLLPDDQLERARQAIAAAGFHPGESLPEAPHHLPAHRLGGGRIGVELHRDLLPDPHPYALDLAAIRARACVAEVAGIETRVLAPTDALHLACVHLAYAHRYRWFLMRGLADILAIVVRFGDGLDWDLFRRTVADARTSGAVYWPLCLARDLLAAPIPGRVLDDLAPPRAVDRLVGPVVRSGDLLAERDPSERDDGVLYRLLLELSLRTGCGAGEQVASVWRGLFPRTSAIAHLPDDVVRSRVRYAAYLTRPSRAFRGLAAVARLAAGKAGD